MSSAASPAARPTTDPAQWNLKAPYGWRSIAFALIAFAVLAVTGKNTEMDQMAGYFGEWFGDLVGLREESQIGNGTRKLFEQMFPLVIAERTSIERLDDFDRNHLPLFSHIETEEVISKNYNPATLELEKTVEVREVLVEPFGYLLHVGAKMLQSLEIALWGTIISILVSIPLAYWSAANYTPNRFGYHIARGVVSFLRAIPELVSALFLVLAFGFGPIAGVLALGLHCAGFLGKFYAEDIENADKSPQEALLAVNAGKIKTLWYGVLPQVFPQYVAYTLYILDRNVRMAIVVGIVGAGGIGMELKGRFDMFNYGHVTTILLVLFLTVFALDQIAARIRSKLI